MSRRRGQGHGRDNSGRRGYPRVARVNEALREVIAEELEHIDDDRLALVTVTGVAADPDFRHATVWFSALHSGTTIDTVAVLGEHRIRLQAAVGRQVRLKRTPELHFKPDPAIAEGLKIDEILRHLPPPAPDAGDGPDAIDAGEPGARGGTAIVDE